MSKEAKPAEQDNACPICGCMMHRNGDYARPSAKGRSHATKHHYVAERFFGRSANRKNSKPRERIPLIKDLRDQEGETGEFCYECHEELLHNPVLLPGDIAIFSELVARNRLKEKEKSKRRNMRGKRIKLFHEIISTGLKVLQRRKRK